jgi:hypothetical protein
MSKDTNPKDLNEIVDLVIRMGKVDRITVSRTHKTPNGDLFLSKSYRFDEVSESGATFGGLTLHESDIATMMLSKDVEVDLVYRALASKMITHEQAKSLVDLAESRFGTVAKYIAKKSLKQEEAG